MKHNNKIIFLAIFLLIIPGFLPYGFSFSKKVLKDNLVSHTELCCCGNNASTCSDCGCPVNSTFTGNDHYADANGLNGHGDEVEYLSIINTCGGGGGSHDAFAAPDLNYLVSLSSYDNYKPVSFSKGTINPRYRGPRLTPPYKPPKS